MCILEAGPFYMDPKQIWEGTLGDAVFLPDRNDCERDFLILSFQIDFSVSCAGLAGRNVKC